MCHNYINTSRPLPLVSYSCPFFWEVYHPSITNTLFHSYLVLIWFYIAVNIHINEFRVCVLGAYVREVSIYIIPFRLWISILCMKPGHYPAITLLPRSDYLGNNLIIIEYFSSVLRDNVSIQQDRRASSIMLILLIYLNAFHFVFLFNMDIFK